VVSIIWADTGALYYYVGKFLVENLTSGLAGRWVRDPAFHGYNLSKIKRRARLGLIDRARPNKQTQRWLIRHQFNLSLEDLRIFEGYPQPESFLVQIRSDGFHHRKEP